MSEATYAVKSDVPSWIEESAFTPGELRWTEHFAWATKFTRERACEIAAARGGRVVKRVRR